MRSESLALENKSSLEIHGPSTRSIRCISVDEDQRILQESHQFQQERLRS